MRRERGVRMLSLLLLLGGAILLAIAATRGEIELTLIIIFPVIWGNGPIAALGFLLIFLGFVLGLASLFFRSAETAIDGESRFDSGRKTRGAGVVLIGPVPIVFGSDWIAATLAIILAMALMIGNPTSPALIGAPWRPDRPLPWPSWPSP